MVKIGAELPKLSQNIRFFGPPCMFLCGGCRNSLSFGDYTPGISVQYPVYTIKQSSSKHGANIEQLEHTLCTCILNAFAGCLLDDFLMFAWSCKRGISHNEPYRGDTASPLSQFDTD